MKRLKNIFYSSSMLILTLLFSCGYEPEVERAGSRPDLSTQDILSAQGYTILNDAIAHAGLEATLEGSSGVTILAPTDAAFVSFMDQLGVSSISEVDAATVAAVLSYHVVSADLRLAELPANAATLSEDVVYFSAGGSINGKAQVVGGEWLSSNATIVGINKVLDVPAGNLLSQMQANDSLSVLVSAIEAAGIQSLFTGTNQYTVLAPTNQAFEGVDVAALTAEQLTEILSFHVIASTQFSTELLAEEKVATILGTEADDNVQELIISDGTINGVSVVNANIAANNGVIHIVESIISQSNTLADAFSAATNATGFDTFGFDAFGDIITGTGYTAYDDLSETYSVYAPFQRLTYASFASDAEAITYLENHTFEGNVNIWTSANGTKVTAINGSSYYMQSDASGRVYTHTGSNNAFTDGARTFGLYNGTVSIPFGIFSPLPEENLLEVISADYSLFAALVTKLERTSLLTSGEATVFAVNDSVFTAGTGLASVAEIEALDAEADAEFLEILDGILLDHIVSSVNFSIYIGDNLPELETAGENTLDFAVVNGDLVIIIDPDFPDTENVVVVDADLAASNGAIHEVNSFIAL